MAQSKPTPGPGPIRINSHKVDSRNGRGRHEFAGDYHSDKFGIVFSCDALILNLTDGERAWSVCFDAEATEKLAIRFAARAAIAKATGDSNA